MCRSTSPSATPPATGAMSWRARASPTRRRRSILNRDFVSIKVDREERPDVDQIYMRALHALGEQGGWPLTMFLTPDAEPFWGGTYFPPEPRFGRPSFRQILSRRQRGMVVGRQRGRTERLRAAGHLNQPVAPAAGRPIPLSSTPPPSTILSVWDLERGSFKGAPKFPNPVVIDVSGAPSAAPATRRFATPSTAR